MLLRSLNKLLHSGPKIPTDLVLSPTNRLECIERLRQIKLLGGTTKYHKKAAVLVPLCINNSELSLLLTLRSYELNHNAGQVAFPGGIYDKSDQSLEFTALRETYEEIGIPRENVDIWGPGPPVGRMDIMVSPFLGYLGNIDLKKLKLNRSEVETAFTIPLSVFCLPESFKTTRFRTSFGHYTLPVYKLSNHTIWGVTALIIHVMLVAIIPDYYNRHLPQFTLREMQNVPSMKQT